MDGSYCNNKDNRSNKDRNRRSNLNRDYENGEYDLNIDSWYFRCNRYPPHLLQYPNSSLLRKK